MMLVRAAAAIDLSGIGIDYTAILPELVVTATAIVVLLLELFVPPGRRRILAAVTVIGLVGALVATIPLWGHTRSAFSGTVTGDSLAAFMNVVLIGVTIFTAIISPRYLRALRLDYGEYYILLLGATLGMMLLAAATSLMTIFLGIELLSICLYVLCGFARTELRSQESALKYLLLGGFATGFLLYGMALIYGATGSTTLRGIAAVATAGAAGNVLLLLGIGSLDLVRDERDLTRITCASRRRLGQAADGASPRDCGGRQVARRAARADRRAL